MSGDTDHWPSSTLGCAHPPLPPSLSSAPPTATLRRTGPTPLLFCSGRVAASCEQPHLHLPLHLSTDIPRIPRMESGKKSLLKCCKVLSLIVLDSFASNWAHLCPFCAPNHLLDRLWNIFFSPVLGVKIKLYLFHHSDTLHWRNLPPLRPQSSSSHHPWSLP